MCIDCGADISHRRSNARRCRPCNYAVQSARRLAHYHATKTCALVIAPCDSCGALYVKRRGNAMFCADCRIFYRREQSAAASRRHYARRIKPMRRAA